MGDDVAELPEPGGLPGHEVVRVAIDRDRAPAREEEAVVVAVLEREAEVAVEAEPQPADRVVPLGEVAPAIVELLGARRGTA